VDVYLEPGEAVALDAGVLVASVQDVVRNETDIAILDVSATCHMPDVLEMPYRPEIAGAGLPGEKPYTCRLAGPSCLAGDVIGDYSFHRPLAVGDRLLFLDMGHYTMVKTTMFNGVKHPGIAVWDPDSGEARVVRRFSYEDFRSRLG
jgi:carboxynorspermidine decarboxylase